MSLDHRQHYFFKIESGTIEGCSVQKVISFVIWKYLQNIPIYKFISLHYGSENGPFKIQIVITHLSHKLPENNFNQNYSVAESKGGASSACPRVQIRSL